MPDIADDPAGDREHPRALVALVLGIVGVAVCQLVAPFAWGIGKRAVREIDASGGTLGGRGPAQTGYVLGVVGTVMLVVATALFIVLIFLGVLPQ
jgi:hypothetical protein